jgi:8-oxo-dGTP pyrophosphatase MutT (NUDIX family)
MSREADLFRAVAARNLVRVRVAAIVIRDQWLLVQRPTDDPHAGFAFIGGEYEVGDTFESRLRREFEEETTARVIRAEYRFVVENRFLVDGCLIQSITSRSRSTAPRSAAATRGSPSTGYRLIAWRVSTCARG